MTDPNRKKLADRLRTAREAKGLSQEDVAKHLSLPRPAISQIENGNRRVEALELARFAKLYDRPLSFFAEDGVVGDERLSALTRTASELSDRDRAEVLRFAEYLKQKASTPEDKK